MPKTITPEKLRKIHEREQREIARWEKERSRPKSKAYIYYILAIVSFVYISDEIATQIGTQMQTEIAHSLFAPIYGEDNAVARMGVFEIFTYIGILLGLVYRPLSDRYGRRVFLVFNTFGMGLGLIGIGLATNIPVYVIGATVTSFFTPYDMQTVYIAEAAPEQHRAKYNAITKGIATTGMLLIPLFRTVFMGADVSRWRNVYLAVAAVVFFSALIALLFSRETDPFIESRLKYLRTPYAERMEQKKQKNISEAQGGFGAACKLCFRHKQLWYALISWGLILCGITMTTYYTVTMTYGYAQIFTSQGTDLVAAKELAAPYVTMALFLFPVGSALPQFVQGFLADKIGRKPAVLLMSILCVVSYILFYLGTILMWNPYLVGLFCGIAVGALWASGDTVNLMILESTPTNLRSSVSVVTTLAGTIFTLVQAIQLVLVNIFGDASAGIISVLLAIPPMILGIIVLSAKVQETKGVDMTNVTVRDI